MDRWYRYNPNPDGNRTGDCTIRAICRATGKDWDTVFAGVTAFAYSLKDMPDTNRVWGAYLRSQGFRRYLVDDRGRDDYTVRDFCADNPTGIYVLCIDGHVVCVEDGFYCDTWDSGDEIPIYYWRR